MICQNPPQQNPILKSRFSLSLCSSNPQTNINNENAASTNIGKRPNPTATAINVKTNINDTIRCPSTDEEEPSTTAQHWSKIEYYYVERLKSLSNEIETSIQQNSKLSFARDELLQEILKLHQKSIELNNKNESLSRSIAEKENHISAFMHNTPPSVVEKKHIGITLEDKPYSLPEDPSCSTSSSSSSSSAITAVQNNNIDAKPNKQGIFRQISLRLSGRKKRQLDENSNTASNTLNISEPINPITNDTTIPTASHPEPLLHPAAVVNNYESNKRKKNLVFGNDLTLQAKSENSVIPAIVLKCVREVESRGLSVEGIYRKSGLFGQIKELQDAFDENKNPKLSRYQDIHVIASLLKLYLRELSSPLLSQDFILPPSLSAQERLNMTYTLLHRMPIEPYCTVKFLVQHLTRIHQNKHLNKMPSKNLAVIFGPTLMRFEKENEEAQMKGMIDAIEYIISNSQILFAEL